MCSHDFRPSTLATAPGGLIVHGYRIRAEVDDAGRPSAWAAFDAATGELGAEMLSLFDLWLWCACPKRARTR